MLRNILMGSSFALLVSAGAANADRLHEVGHGPVVREHVTVREPVVRERVVREPVRPVVRGAVYMPRPVIRERYFDFHRRPELVVEDFGFRPGFVWVRGHWDWNGAEWIWMPGYYQPI